MRNGPQLTAQDLRHWKMLQHFQDELASVIGKAVLPASFSHPARTLDYSSYLSLFLLGLFNPVVQSMRSLCALSHLSKVQEYTGCRPVSLGSFSEMQHLVEPDLLKQVFERLVEKVPQSPNADPKLAHLELIAQDGSLWSALPRMAWAEYGVGSKGEAKGVRLHLRFNILKDRPEEVLITPGKGCEARAMRQMLLPGQTNVGDRYYGKDYRLFREIHQSRAFFVFRISDTAVIQTVEGLPVSGPDAAAGVVRHAWVCLGATEKLRSMPVRLVEVKKDGQHLLLITNHLVESVPAELVSLIYRKRWSIELFFRWIKCLLGCRHFFAESPQGVALQLYLALIASVILQFLTGVRPSKRIMEFLQFHTMGWASTEEVLALIQRETSKKR